MSIAFDSDRASVKVFSRVLATFVVLTFSTLLAACGDQTNAPPTVVSLRVLTDEDTPVSGQLIAIDLDSSAVTFALARAAEAGTVAVDRTGAFSYTPFADRYGTDRFGVIAIDDRGATSRVTEVRVTVVPVNDAPTIAPLAALENSAETLESKVPVIVADVDEDPLTVTASVADPDVATVSFNEAQGELVITPKNYGTSTIEVGVTDGYLTTTTRFNFTVKDLVKQRSLPNDASDAQAVEIRNTSSQVVHFTLTHNDEALQTSVDGIVEVVRNLPDEVPSEGFERKLWRYLRDITYHNYPLSTKAFIHDPVLFSNSIGWGFCDDVATAYMFIARAAGYESRVWYLDGHVVPEILVEDRWEMYDPDLAVYYLLGDGRTVAGVEELARDPALITTPVSGMFTGASWSTAHSQYVADIYASAEDNQLADDFVPGLVAPQTPQPAIFLLPPGSSVLYPVKDAAGVTGTDQVERYEVDVYANLKMIIPAGWLGTIPLPLQLVTVRGSGIVGVDGTEFHIASPDLESRLQEPVSALRELSIVESASDLELVFLINPLRFYRQSTDVVSVTGKDVWGLTIQQTRIGHWEQTLEEHLNAVRRPALHD